MKNPNDYDAGWTKRTFNPKTGKYSSGGAARNMHIASQGGAQAVHDAGGLSVLSQLTPLVEQLQNQLTMSQQLNIDLTKELNKVRRQNKA